MVNFRCTLWRGRIRVRIRTHTHTRARDTRPLRGDRNYIRDPISGGKFITIVAADNKRIRRGPANAARCPHEIFSLLILGPVSP